MSGPTLEDTIAFAALCHRGQKDKSGSAYILHPLEVMRGCDTDEERIIAVLHDIVEDCGISFEMLRRMGYCATVVEALDYLTHREDENYEDFIARNAKGPRVARKIKLLDLRHNTDPKRIPRPTPRDIERTGKYIRAMEVIRLALD